MAIREVYEFGVFTLEASERRLSRNGQTIPLEPKAHDVLLALLRRAGRLVTKRDLLELVWRESFVEEGILAVYISTLRKVLGDGAGGQQYIETVSRSGYRLVAAVREVKEQDAGPASKQWSVAVLPARPVGGILSEPDTSKGLAIADALIDRLGREHQILVRPTRAVYAYANSGEDPAAIGRFLRVDAVVDSHFLGTSDGIRISVRLIRSQDSSTLWSGEFEETPGDAVTTANVVAECIAARLRGGFKEDATRDWALRPATNSKVYELVGRGRFHLLAASMFEAPKAAEAFQAAIELDPDYAPAHAGLALACCTRAALRLAPPSESYHAARNSALRALALDDSCADAQVALGAVMLFSEWNWTGAERSLKRAIELNPNHSEAYLLYGQLLDALGRLDEGLEAKLRVLERDPFSPLVHLQISLSYWNQRRYDDAIEWANKALELDPLHPHAREHLAAAYLKKGDVDQYLAENLKHAELHGAPPGALEHLKLVWAEGADGPPWSKGFCNGLLSSHRLFRPCSWRYSMGKPGIWMRHSNIWSGRSKATTRPSFHSRLHRNGTFCGGIRVLVYVCPGWA
jgi:DNA-binding winged helix-turn-helix (wHTH) protein/tetratricopeptide (TPR) repeat protein